MSTIKTWLERLPSRMPETQRACTLIQTACMQAEIDELRTYRDNTIECLRVALDEVGTLRADNERLRAALKTLSDGCRSPTQVGVLLGLDLARAALGAKT